MRRIMLAGVSSGSGKTTLTCGILQALANRGFKAASFKCGPDYIDPMFHRKAIGTPSFNLDSFFCGEDALKYLLHTNAGEADICVLEGVMGYYDGLGFSDRHSSYALARLTQTPAVLVMDCKGMGASLSAVLSGFVRHREDSGIAGVIFNRLPPSLYAGASAAAQSLGVRPLGYLPALKEWKLESRHLGLVTADELSGLQAQLAALALKIEETVDINGLLELSSGAAELERPDFPHPRCGKPLKIAVASDEAFCFLYPDNLRFLERCGAQPVFFSPLRDSGLPAGISGLLLCGGYPELYARALSENSALKAQIRDALHKGLPCIAECGGFMYLHEALEDAQGATYPMAGFLPGKCFKTARLQRFGYAEMTARKSGLICEEGNTLRMHEFHYWDSPQNGRDFLARKEGRPPWECGILTETFYGGFPHLYFYGNPKAAGHFLERCEAYGL